MKQCKKWNFEKHEYDIADIPEECLIICDDMNKIIKCANCHKPIKFGDCFTSYQYQTNIGLGYPVCENCYGIEWEKRFPYERYKD